MNEIKYTPGPWNWTIYDHSCASLGVGDDPGMGTPLVMSVSPCQSCVDRVKNGEWEWGRCHTPSEANARLIAAAPELLEACKTLLFDAFEDAHPEAVKQARVAIAKAEGRS